jgi:hypothetical protein
MEIQAPAVIFKNTKSIGDLVCTAIESRMLGSFKQEKLPSRSEFIT